LIKAAWFLEMDIDEAVSVEDFWRQAVPAWGALWGMDPA